MDKESIKSSIELIFERITYANIIRYLLAAVMLMKSYEYFINEKITLEVDLSSGLFFFIAFGIVFYWVYRPTYYDIFFMWVLDKVVWLHRKIFKNSKVDNYRQYFKREEGLKKEDRMTFYFLLKDELTKTYYNNSINLKATSIHFFAISSFTFLIFSLWSLDIDSKTFNDIITDKTETFFWLWLVSFVFALYVDIDLEKMELKNIKQLKKNTVKRKEYDNLLSKIKEDYSNE